MISSSIWQKIWGLRDGGTIQSVELAVKLGRVRIARSGVSAKHHSSSRPGHSRRGAGLVPQLRLQACTFLSHILKSSKVESPRGGECVSRPMALSFEPQGLPGLGVVYLPGNYKEGLQCVCISSPSSMPWFHRQHTVSRRLLICGETFSALGFENQCFFASSTTHTGVEGGPTCAGTVLHSRAMPSRVQAAASGEWRRSCGWSSHTARTP